MGISLSKSCLRFYRVTRNIPGHGTSPCFLGLPNFLSAYSSSGLFALEAHLPFNCNPLHLRISKRFALFSCLECHFDTYVSRQASKLHLRSLGKPQKLVSSAAAWVTAITYISHTISDVKKHVLTPMQTEGE